jgi:KaiC/GvpD/RAD55 family RecA-like ATPase
MASGERSSLSNCLGCGQPYQRDELTGLMYCVHCDLILSVIPEGRTYMLLGKSGSGKSIFLYKLMDLYIRSSRPCVYVALDELPSQLRASLGGLVQGVEKSEREGLLTFVDCYSCMGGLASQENYHIDSPGDLTGLGFLLSKLVADLGKQQPVKVCLDSVTAMLAHCDPDAIVKFLYSTSARVKSLGGSLLFTLNGGAVSPEIQKRLEQLADGLVEFRVTEGEGATKRYYRFSKVRGKLYYDTWNPFFVGKNAIMLAPPEEGEMRERFYKVFDLLKAG